MKLIRTNQESKDFKSLVLLLDKELAIRDGEDHAFYHQFNGLDHLNHVIVAYINGNAVGCGAFKQRSKSQIEIKGMFVKESQRQKGVALHLLKGLEQWAKKLNFKDAILETGKAQHEALSFYPKQGYAICPNFPPYQGIINSVCFKKRL